MPRQNFPTAKTTAIGRSKRITIAVALAVSGAYVAAQSLAPVVAKVDPESGAKIAPGNGLLQGRAAEAAFQRLPSNDRRIADLAQASVLRDATSVKALNLLGFQAQLRGETDKSHRIFAHALRLSRRELQLSLWAIEDAVTRGDLDTALRFHDIALRTTASSRDMLFPVLATALVEPVIRAKLIRILASRPVWADDFITFAANSGLEPEGAIALLREGRSDGIRAGDDLRANLVNALVSQNKAEEGWQFYEQFRPDVNRRFSRDPRFTFANDTRAYFDWRAGEEEGLSAAFLSDRDNGSLQFSAATGRSGTLAWQTQLFPAGIYVLEGRSEDVNQPSRSRPFWRLVCANGKELGRVDVPNSSDNNGNFGGRFVVPKDCPVQTLELVARPTYEAAGVAGEITLLRVRPQELD